MKNNLNLLQRKRKEQGSKLKKKASIFFLCSRDMENYSITPKFLNLSIFDFYYLRILYWDPRLYFVSVLILLCWGRREKANEKRKKRDKTFSCSHFNNKNVWSLCQWVFLKSEVPWRWFRTFILPGKACLTSYSFFFIGLISYFLDQFIVFWD